MPAAVAYRLHVRLGGRRRSVFTLHPRQVRHRLAVRSHTSDLEVFAQIFIGREYDGLRDLPDVRLIVDCGANVGYSSAYFLSCFPRCEVIALEPDPGNFALLQQNLRPYGRRATAVRAGVWSHATRLALVKQPYRGGGAWTRQVEECAPGEPESIEGIDIGSLLARSGHERISLLKVDIEGAEAVVFARNCESWLRCVDAIAIELHDDSAFGSGSAVFAAAIDGQGFRLSRSSELTICRR